MKTFFDYVFYSIYFWNKKMDESFNKIMPVISDPLFVAVWGLTFLHTANLYTIYYGGIYLFDLRQYMYRPDYTLYILFGICFLCDYYYYIRLKKYHSVFSKYRKKKINVLGAIIYLVLSIVVAGLAVSWAHGRI